MGDFIQLHVLTSYPPANLNRDDLGRPKTAMLGGTQRLRISSQSLKRAWRTSEVFGAALAGMLGTRTKDLGNYVHGALVKAKVDPERADRVAQQVAGVFGKLKGGGEKAGEAEEEDEVPKAKTGKKQVGKKGNGSEDPKARVVARQIEQLVHVSAAEWKAIDRLIEKVAKGAEVSHADCEALVEDGHGSPDIALFGRMLAARPNHNVEAAAQVAHAISVHKVTVEDDYFTAVDDLNEGEEDLGAGHIGTTEFAAGLFYQYVCIDRRLLLENLDADQDLARKTLRALVEAVATVAPAGKQNSFGSRARASYILAERGDQQPRSLSVAFLRPVTGDDYLAEAIQALQSTREKMDKVYGPCATASCVLDAYNGTGSLAELLDFVGA